jgi:SAM-dependent methyltransferase
MDESDDALFYTQPRLVVHIDEQAIACVTGLLREYLPPGGDILDLMSSWRSHLPEDVRFGRVVGLGMNEVELRENPQLSERLVHNLNLDPRLPFGDSSFDGAVITVSVQYLTQPVAVYREVGRVLRPGAAFLTIFSNRMFPTKAVSVWHALDDAGHAQLVSDYYARAGGFEQIEAFDASGPRGDPVFLVLGRRSPA